MQNICRIIAVIQINKNVWKDLKILVEGLILNVLVVSKNTETWNDGISFSITPPLIILILVDESTGNYNYHISHVASKIACKHNHEDQN